MNLVDNVLEMIARRLLKSKEKAVGPLIDDSRIYRSLSELMGRQSDIVKRPYSQSVWVYSCINTISTNLSRVPFVLKKDAGTLEPDVITTGPLHDLFQNPNPYMVQEELIAATFIYYCLRGEAFWILEGRKDESQVPTEIWTFDPIRFEPIIEKSSGMLAGWKYKGITDIEFSVNEVIQFKMYNPYNDLRGLSPIEAAKVSMESDYHASVYNKMFFENGAVTSLNISIPDELGDDAYNRLVRQIEQRHKGRDRAHRILVAEGGAKITESRLGQRDMEFIEGKKMSREEIMAVYKVNEVVLGIYKDIKSYEGIKSAHKAFWEECLMPKVTYFEGVLWARFFSKIGNRRGKGRVWGQFDLATVGPLQINYEEKVLTAHRMWSMGWPINMINRRLEMGMKEVAWGDEWWVPGGFLPVTSLMGAKPPGEEDDDEPKKEPDEDEQGDTEKKPEGEDEQPPPKKMLNDKDGIYKEYIAKELKEALKKFLFAQRKAVLEALYSGKSMDVGEKEYEKLRKNLSSIYFSAIYSGQMAIRSDLKMEPPVMSGNGNEGEIKAFIEAKTSFVVSNFRGLLNNFIDSMGKLDVERIEKDIVADKVREIFNFLTNKCSTLSRNESDAAFSFGKNLAAKGFIGEFRQQLTLD